MIPIPKHTVNPYSQNSPRSKTGTGFVCGFDDIEVLIILEDGRLVWAEKTRFLTHYPDLRTYINYFVFLNNPNKFWII
jgi:hypothetical protein